jgi:hypothetical protein
MSEWGDPFCAFERTDPDLCGYGLEAHHVIPKATIRGQYSYWNGLMPSRRKSKGLPEVLPDLEYALADRRNLIPLCRHHHELVTNARLYVPSFSWPEGIWDFAEETGLTWYLDKWAEAS